MTILLVLAVCFLAFANGANDNFKGVASLFGSGTTSYRAAITWATATTMAGSLAAGLLAQSLLRNFSGSGLVPDALVGSEHLLVAVAVGAGATVILATFAGFPVSTTHALTGALVGSGWVAAGPPVNLAVLGKLFVLPLLLSPLLAIGLGVVLYIGSRWVRLRTGITKEWCLCVGEEHSVVAMPQPGSVLALQEAAPIVTACVGVHSTCTQRYAGRLWGVGVQEVTDAAHYLSAGLVGFARGLNDTPKMAALLLVPAVGGRLGVGTVAVAMAVGGLLSARRVAETVSQKITTMTHGQGLAANLTTGLLVTAASLFGLPVSTTHVSVGALFGIGVVSRQADGRVVRGILLSWVITLPCAAAIGALVFGLGVGHAW